jgi:hypothetical protein
MWRATFNQRKNQLCWGKSSSAEGHHVEIGRYSFLPFFPTNTQVFSFFFPSWFLPPRNIKPFHTNLSPWRLLEWAFWSRDQRRNWGNLQSPLVCAVSRFRALKKSKGCLYYEFVFLLRLGALVETTGQDKISVFLQFGNLELWRSKVRRSWKKLAVCSWSPSLKESFEKKIVHNNSGVFCLGKFAFPKSWSRGSKKFLLFLCLVWDLEARGSKISLMCCFVVSCVFSKPSS